MATHHYLHYVIGIICFGGGYLFCLLCLSHVRATIARMAVELCTSVARTKERERTAQEILGRIEHTVSRQRCLAARRALMALHGQVLSLGDAKTANDLLATLDVIDAAIHYREPVVVDETICGDTAQAVVSKSHP